MNEKLDIKVFEYIKMFSENRLIGVQPSSLFYNYLIKFISKFDEFDDKVRIKILRSIAEISYFITNDDARNSIDIIFTFLIQNLPLPP
jgi:hypothetical protein